MKSYGITNKKEELSTIDYHLENIKIKGFSLLESLISSKECEIITESLEGIYKKQEKDFGVENLQQINELDIARMPFLSDRVLFKLFMHPFVLELTEKVLGNHFHLHLQNGIINRPNKEHHQTSWHRDLPYQDWVISKPLGFNAFFCLSDFTLNNGSTFVLPYSHRLDYFPNPKFVKENEIQLTAPAGSVIFFDSMLYHRAGVNTSKKTRFGVNNMYVVPILKQQIDIMYNIEKDNLILSDKESAILGNNFRVPKTVKLFRKKRQDKIK